MSVFQVPHLQKFQEKFPNHHALIFQFLIMIFHIWIQNKKYLSHFTFNLTVCFRLEFTQLATIVFILNFLRKSGSESRIHNEQPSL